MEGIITVINVELGKVSKHIGQKTGLELKRELSQQYQTLNLENILLISLKPIRDNHIIMPIANQYIYMFNEVSVRIGEPQNNLTAPVIPEPQFAVFITYVPDGISTNLPLNMLKEFSHSFKHNVGIVKEIQRCANFCKEQFIECIQSRQHQISGLLEALGHGSDTICSSLNTIETFKNGHYMPAMIKIFELASTFDQVIQRLQSVKLDTGIATDTKTTLLDGIDINEAKNAQKRLVEKYEEGKKKFDDLERRGIFIRENVEAKVRDARSLKLSEMTYEVPQNIIDQINEIVIKQMTDLQDICTKIKELELTPNTNRWEFCQEFDNINKLQTTQCDTAKNLLVKLKQHLISLFTKPVASTNQDLTLYIHSILNVCFAGIQELKDLEIQTQAIQNLLTQQNSAVLLLESLNDLPLRYDNAIKEIGRRRGWHVALQSEVKKFGDMCKTIIQIERATRDVFQSENVIPTFLAPYFQQPTPQISCSLNPAESTLPPVDTPTVTVNVIQQTPQPPSTTTPPPSSPLPLNQNSSSPSENELRLQKELKAQTSKSATLAARIKKLEHQLEARVHDSLSIKDTNSQSLLGEQQGSLYAETCVQGLTQDAIEANQLIEEYKSFVKTLGVTIKDIKYGDTILVKKLRAYEIIQAGKVRYALSAESQQNFRQKYGKESTQLILAKVVHVSDTKDDSELIKVELEFIL